MGIFSSPNDRQQLQLTKLTVPSTVKGVDRRKHYSILCYLSYTKIRDSTGKLYWQPNFDYSSIGESYAKSVNLVDWWSYEI